MRKSIKRCEIVQGIICKFYNGVLLGLVLGAFYNCSKLQYNEYHNALYLSNSQNPYVALIKANNTSITSCTINNNTKVIASRAFSDCSKLTSTTIPDSVTSIGLGAFRDCGKLSKVYYKGSATEWDNIEISSHDNSPLTSATRYYYSETNPYISKPNDTNKYWYYDGDEIVVWTK